MTDETPILDYAQPRPSWFMKVIGRIPVDVAATFNPIAAAFNAWLIVPALKAHHSSFGGCAFGRLHDLDYLVFAIVPVLTAILYKAAEANGTGWLVRLARFGMLAALATYGVMIADVAGLLEILKYDILRMR